MNILRENPDIPPPLPEHAYKAACDSIIGLGFSSDAIIKNYRFSDPNEQTITVNALAFADPIHRTPAEYAGFTLFNTNSDNVRDEEVLIRTLAQSAAPFHLIHRNERFSFWGSTVNNNKIQPIRIATDIAYGQLDSVLSDYKTDLQPQRLVAVKQGREQFISPIFREIQPLQLSLFVVDVTRKLLISYFSNAVAVLRSYKQEGSTPLSNEDITKIALQLLGAIILADTGVLDASVRAEDTSLSHLIRTAQKRFPRYFDIERFERYADVVEQVYRLLRRISYAGFVPDMLTEIYEAAYNRQSRKEWGRFDTPLYLTRRMWDYIPVEFLPPEQRVVADLTCGWGSFLIAGYERFSRLNDMQDSSLRELFHGNDSNSFTAQLAGLGLLLSTSDDSWDISSEDAFTWSWLKKEQPNIIVGNPPFGDSRKNSGSTEVSLTDNPERYEKANQFLEYAIDRLKPNGYLAMLMPQSFVAAEAAPRLRQKLLETCDIQELWELPIGVFRDARANTIALFVQKKRGSNHLPVRVRTIQPGKPLSNFQKSGNFTASALVADQSSWGESSRKSHGSKNAYIFDYRLILSTAKWDSIRSICKQLDEVATIMRGAIRGENPRRKRWSDYSSPKQVPWLTGAQRVMPRSFFIDYKHASTIVYPNELEEPRKDHDPERDKEKYLANTKVLLSALNNPSWGKRVNVAIERQNHYVSDHFWVIVPNSELQHITHEVLAAVLNWKVSNGWILEHLKSTYLPSRAIRSIPFPPALSEEDCINLTSAVNELERAALADQSIRAEAQDTIDRILKNAYQLDDDTYQRLSIVYNWGKDAKISLDSEPNNSATWVTSGVVDEVNANQEKLTLWLQSFTDLQTVPIVSWMPGWMLRPDVCFTVNIPRRWVQKGIVDSNVWGLFVPQLYSYLSGDELLKEVAQVLNEQR